MKAARDYITTLRKSLGEWENFYDNGEQLIDSFGKSVFLEFVEHSTKALKTLDPHTVEDSILEHEDSIAMRLKRMDDYKLLPTIEVIRDTMGINAQQYDADVNVAINRHRQLIEAKALALIKVIERCKKYVSPKHPIIAKALANPILLSYFYNNKRVLEDYISFCIAADTPTQRARRAGELAKDGKIKRDYIYTPLQECIKKLGFDAGNYKTWQGAALKALS